MTGIFISYRRTDSAYIAGRLHDRLAAHFGAQNIFRDIDTIRPGADFVDRIEQAVGSCNALVAMIGADWLQLVDEKGRRRIDNPRDFVRLEIAAALKRDILVIPVLVENVRMPSEADLPPALRKLARRNALDLTDARWEYDVQHLIQALEDVVPPKPATREPRPAPEPAPAPEPRAPVPPPFNPWASPAPPSSPPPPSSYPPTSPSPWAVGPRPEPVQPASDDTGLVPRWVKVAIPAVVLAVVVIAGVAVALTAGSPKPSDGGGSSGTSAPPTTRVITGPWTGSNGGLSVTVEQIDVGSDGMRIHMAVNNGTGDSVVLPRQFFTAVDDAGNSYEADMFSSEWPDQIPRGLIKGVMDVAGTPSPDASSLKVGWTTVGGRASFTIDDIYVENIALS